jgi:hypothetical protein
MTGIEKVGTHSVPYKAVDKPVPIPFVWLGYNSLCRENWARFTAFGISYTSRQARRKRKLSNFIDVYQSK